MIKIGNKEKHFFVENINLLSNNKIPTIIIILILSIIQVKFWRKIS